MSIYLPIWLLCLTQHVFNQNFIFHNIYDDYLTFFFYTKNELNILSEAISCVPKL